MPPQWAVDLSVHEGGGLLDYRIRAVDYSRWQILKEFAKLVTIFDDHDVPYSSDECEAWEMDALAIDSD